MYHVRYGVRGATRVSVKVFATAKDACAFRDIWTFSNTRGDYVARVVYVP